MNNERYNQIVDEAYENYGDKLLFNEIDCYCDTELNKPNKTFIPYNQEKFINKCKTDLDFSERWELKIEERELTTVRERKKYDVYFDDLIGEYPEHHETLDKRGAPRKIIIVTYNNETIEVYE